MSSAVVTKQFVANKASSIGSLTFKDQRYVVSHDYPDAGDHNLYSFKGLMFFFLSWFLFLWKCIRQKKNPLVSYQLYIDDDLTHPSWIVKASILSIPYLGRHRVEIDRDNADTDGLHYHQQAVATIYPKLTDPQIAGVALSSSGFSFRCSLSRWQSYVDARINQTMSKKSD